MTRRRSVLVAALACALCGGWAGAGSGNLGTFALLSDTAAVTADAGAGSLWLTRALPPGETQAPVTVVGPDVDADVPVSISTTDETSWVLTARVLPAGDGDADCGPMAGSGLSLGASGASPRTVGACGPEGELARGTGATISSVVVRWSGTPDVATTWEGRVQLMVTQEGGGFSDRLDIPVEMLTPALLPPADGGLMGLPQAELPPVVLTDGEDPATQEPGEPVAEAPAAAATSIPPASTVTPAAPTVVPTAIATAASTPVADEARPSGGSPSDASSSAESGDATPTPDG